MNLKQNNFIIVEDIKIMISNQDIIIIIKTENMIIIINIIKKEIIIITIIMIKIMMKSWIILGPNSLIVRIKK